MAELPKERTFGMPGFFIMAGLFRTEEDEKGRVSLSPSVHPVCGVEYSFVVTGGRDLPEFQHGT
jgi:hypothetical protein